MSTFSCSNSTEFAKQMKDLEVFCQIDLLHPSTHTLENQNLTSKTTILGDFSQISQCHQNLHV